MNNLQETKKEVSTRMKKEENDEKMKMKKRNLFLKVESTQKNVLIVEKSTVFEFDESDDERKDENFLEDVCTDAYDMKFDND